MGEQLLNPACELTDQRAADIIYGKQIAYMLALPALMLLSKAFWVMVSVCQGRPFSFRGANGRSPSHKDGSVATIVFVSYLMYPTLCRQSFALLKCHAVGGTQYLLADLEEPCWTGRHVLFIWLTSVPQIVFYVFGIPAVGLWAAHRSLTKRRKKLKKMVSTQTAAVERSLSKRRLSTTNFSIARFRYGMLYSAFGRKRWYWGAVIAFRKAFIAFLTSAMTDPNLEVHFIVAFLASCIMANIVQEPYIGAQGITPEQARWLQQFDSASLFVLLMTAWSGVFFGSNTAFCEFGGACLALLYLTVGLNMGFFLYCAWIYRTLLLYSLKVALYIFTCRCKDIRKLKKRTKKRSRESVLHNPLYFRRSLVAKQTFENPLVAAGADDETIKRQRRKQSIEMQAVKHMGRVADKRSSRIKRIQSIRRLRSAQLKTDSSEPPAPTDSEWVAMTDPDSGRSYYWNRETNETQWA